MSKVCKNLYIIGIIFSMLILAFSIVLYFCNNIEGFEVLYDVYNKLNEIGIANKNFNTNILICSANGVLMIILVILKKPYKSMAITIIVLSALSSNLFGIVSSIILLVQNKKERPVTTRTYEAVNENGEKVIVKEVVPVVRKERKPIRRLDVKTSDTVLLTIGMILGLVLIYLYIFMLIINEKTLFDFFSLKMSAAEAFYLFIFVFVYALFVIVILLIPAIYIFISIIFSILVLTTRRKFFAKALSISGFLTLNIFSGIAAIRMLKRFKNEEEKEKDLIA